MALVGAAAIVLALTASAPQPASPDVRHFALAVAGPPGARTGLAAGPVPAGWLPTFCTPRVCAPHRVTVTLPRSGVLHLDVRLIRLTGSVAAPRALTVIATAPKELS